MPASQDRIVRIPLKMTGHSGRLRSRGPIEAMAKSSMMITLILAMAASRLRKAAVGVAQREFFEQSRRTHVECA
jgi:hypothetical protein